MEILQEIGSYAGIAAILGLAVLSALYFSQARDVKRLREWAGRAPERGPAGVQPQPAQPRAVTAQPVPQTTQAPSRPVPGGTPPPVPRPPGAPATAAAATGAGPAVARGPAPATPAGAQVDDGDGQPAAGAQVDDGTRTAPAGDELDITKLDTEVHPPPDPDGDADELAGAAVDADGDEEAVEEGSDDLDLDTGEGYAADDLDEDDARYERDDGGLDEEPDDLERTAVHEVGELDTGEHTGDWRPEDEHSDYPLTDEHEVAPLTQAAPTPTPTPTPTPPTPPAPYRRRGPEPATEAGRILPPYEESRPGATPEGPERSTGGRRRLLALVAGAVVLAVVVFGALQLTGGGEEPSSEPTVGLSAGGEDGGETGGGNGGGGGGQPIDPAQVTVAVLNGTTVPGLAATIGDQVTGEGFQLGTVTNSTDQERAESVVLYAPGAEREATEVGSRLGISQREQIDAESQALAGDATVVVIAGADQNQQ